MNLIGLIARTLGLAILTRLLVMYHMELPMKNTEIYVGINYGT